MSLADIKNVLETSSLRIAWLVFVSSVVFLLPDPLVSYLFSVVSSLPDPLASWVLVLRPGFEYYHAATQDTYGMQIFIAFIVSSVLILSRAGSKLLDLLDDQLREHSEWWRNRKGKLKIIKATYGVGETSSNDVTDRVKILIKREDDKDRLIFTVDDDVLLEKGKIDDPMPGSPKTFRIGYSLYRCTEEYKQKEQVEIGCKAD